MIFTGQVGSSGLPYQIPQELVGGYNLGFMFLPKYRAWVILALIVVIMFDVITRKIYWTQQLILTSWAHEYMSSTKLQELEWHLHGVVLLLAFGFAYVCDKHVRIDGWRLTVAELDGRRVSQ